jgi:hypothetical protein
MDDDIFTLFGLIATVAVPALAFFCLTDASLGVAIALSLLLLPFSIPVFAAIGALLRIDAWW